MFKSLQMYIYAVIIVFVVGVLSYIGYVFYDRAEAKKTVVKQKGTIETKKTEIKTTGIAERAKGEIKQVEKRKNYEADTSFGVHSYSF